VSEVMASLLLTGAVEFPDAISGEGSITFTLNGGLGGDELLSVSLTVNYSQCPSGFCALSSIAPTVAGVAYPETGLLPVGPTAIEWLSISSTGEVIYEAGDPNPFVAATPELPSLILFATGGLLAFGMFGARKLA
jgi:hypothetical protein